MTTETWGTFGNFRLIELISSCRNGKKKNSDSKRQSLWYYTGGNPLANLFRKEEESFYKTS